MSQDDDAALLLAFRGGDEAAFRLLYERNARAMIAFCHRFVRDAPRAEELAQDVFVKLYRSAHRYQPSARFRTFLYRVATNHCLNLRRNATRHGEDADAPPLEVAASTSPDLVPDRQLVQQVLGRFDTTTQTVAVGVLVDGMEQEEVAEVLGISRRTVARRLARFLDLARQQVDRS